jgi:hypothetical protein
VFRNGKLINQFSVPDPAAQKRLTQSEVRKVKLRKITELRSLEFFLIKNPIRQKALQAESGIFVENQLSVKRKFLSRQN